MLALRYVHQILQPHVVAVAPMQPWLNKSHASTRVTNCLRTVTTVPWPVDPQIDSNRAYRGSFGMDLGSVFSLKRVQYEENSESEDEICDLYWTLILSNSTSIMRENSINSREIRESRRLFSSSEEEHEEKKKKKNIEISIDATVSQNSRRR
ncbi:hypothetical protein TNCV_3006721 [Trichonephila clavipes]|nr:hypothetical protein TNCV_3006721 [Trichonephila clavipes]